MPPSEWIAIVGLFVGGVGLAVTTAIYITSVKSDFSERIATTKELMYTVVSVQAEKESKARHDLNNHFQTMITGLELALNNTNRRFDTVVQKEDLNATEARLVVAIDKLERRVERNREAAGTGSDG